MAKGKIKIEKSVMLELTIDEAYWLKSLVQNNLDNEEDIRDTEMRKSIFEALPAFESLIE